MKCKILFHMVLSSKFWNISTSSITSYVGKEIPHFKCYSYIFSQDVFGRDYQWILILVFNLVFCFLFFFHNNIFGTSRDRYIFQEIHSVGEGDISFDFMRIIKRNHSPCYSEFCKSDFPSVLCSFLFSAEVIQWFYQSH